MSPIDTLSIARKEVGVSKHIHITHLNTPSVFEAKNGMIGMVLKCEGITFDAERDTVLNQRRRAWHQALLMLDERFCVYVTTHRHQESMELTGEFSHALAREIDAHYQAQFKNSHLYTNDLYLTIVYKGITSGKAGKGLSFLQKLTNKAIKDARAAARANQMKRLDAKVRQLQSTLSDFKPRLLGEQDKTIGYSELIHFLSLTINAGDGLKTPFLFNATSVSKSLQEAKKTRSLYPYGELSQYLSKCRLFFGEGIQFQGATQNQFAAMISIKHYGEASGSIMFDTLLQIDSEFIATHSFAIESKDVALDKVGKHKKRMEAVNDAAVSERQALHTLNDMVASDKVLLGYHHNSVMILSPNKADLERRVNQCIKCYADAGFVAVRETIGQEPCFWAQVPTNQKYIARSSLVTSENFIDFASLHNYRIGYKDGNHLGSAVTLLETPSKTPYFFNCHIRGSSDNPSKGHTMMTGGNGSGKTVMMTFLDAQLNRYAGQSFYFDRDRGAEIYIRASGGSYSTLSPNDPQATCFAPLQLTDTPSNRQFNRDLLISLCKEKDDDYLTAAESELITHCVDYAYDQLAPSHRTLSHATSFLPVNFSRWTSLRRWLRGHDDDSDGEYAYIFDNPVDQLILSSKMGFDMTHFLDNEPAHVRTPLMMYLFQRIEMALNGQLVSVFLDEGWQYFIDTYWIAKLKRVLPTWRKRNAHLIMGTQSPSSIVESPLKSIILDNIATQIYFANPQAKREDYVDGLKLSETEFSIIANNVPQSRLFLVKQEHESTVCKLNLGHMPDKLRLLSGNQASVLLLDQIRAEVGDDPSDWLPIFQQRYGERLG